GGKHLKQVSLELGGNAPFVVLDDADLDAAVQEAITGTFLHSGQICMAVNRIIVHDGIYDEFVERFTAAAKQIPTGDPAADDTLVGPVVNDSQLAGLQKKLDLAKQEGALPVVEGDISGRV